MSVSMFFDETTLILGTVALLLGVAAPFFSPFYRFRRILRQHNVRQEAARGNAEDTTDGTPVTVLVTVHDQARELEAHLPALLSQDYDAGFQVVVVAEQGDQATGDVLKRFANSPHLYTTFIPSSSRYMSRKKLAVTLGVKAARHEWILMTDADCTPTSRDWLRQMAKACTPDGKLVMGYANYAPGTTDFKRMEQLHTALYLMRKACLGTAYRTNSANLAFRKSRFIQEDGYRGNLHLLRGEYDFMVNKYAENGTTALVIDKDAWMVHDEPGKKTWVNKQLFYRETRRHLDRSAAMRALFNTDMTLLHASFLMVAATLAWGCLTTNYALVAIAVAALLLTTILRIQLAKQAMRFFLDDIALWKVIPFELGIVWRNLSYGLRYRKADKDDFTSHKL